METNTPLNCEICGNRLSTTKVKNNLYIGECIYCRNKFLINDLGEIEEYNEEMIKNSREKTNIPALIYYHLLTLAYLIIALFFIFDILKIKSNNFLYLGIGLLIIDSTIPSIINKIFNTDIIKYKQDNNSFLKIFINSLEDLIAVLFWLIIGFFYIKESTNGFTSFNDKNMLYFAVIAIILLYVGISNIVSMIKNICKYLKEKI